MVVGPIEFSLTAANNGPLRILRQAWNPHSGRTTHTKESRQARHLYVTVEFFVKHITRGTLPGLFSNGYSFHGLE